MRPDNPIRHLDPRKLAYYEKENYVRPGHKSNCFDESLQTDIQV